MAGTCPHCKQEITSLREFQKAEVCYEMTIDQDAAHYEKQDDYDGCADWGCAECPNCGEEIETIRSEDAALKFLKGEGV